MSNAASTIPAKRNILQTKPHKIPSLGDVTKKEMKIKKGSKRGKTDKADVLKVNHKDINQADTSQDYSDYGRLEDEETWMKKTNNVLQSGLHKLETRVNEHITHRKGKLADAATGLPGAAKKPTIKIMHIQQYESFMEERKQLLEINEKSAKRIEELEQEVARVLREFGDLYEDNEKLRRKMDTGKEPLLEPYSRVFEDRRVLREAESGYKKRIIRLEKEIMEKQTECDKFQDQVKILRAKVNPTSKAEDKEKKTKEMKLHAELKKLRTENETLKSNFMELEKSNSQTSTWKVKSENDALRSIIKKLELQLLDNETNDNKTPTTKNDKPKVRTGGKINQVSLDEPKAKRRSKLYQISLDEPKSKTGSKLYQVSFEDKPFVFDYEYMLPDSQIYD